MEKNSCDLVIVGGGPAGLSASICAASEGLKVIICDTAMRMGGQAGESSLIENFFGFPEGISGIEMTRKAVAQADKFGVQFNVPFTAEKLEKEGHLWKLHSNDGEYVLAKTVLLTMGASYRRLEAVGVSRFIGAGVHYGSPSMSEVYDGMTVVIVGAANSAGQAATYLSKCPGCRVIMIVRGPEVRMSEYMSHRVLADQGIEIITEAQVQEVTGCLNMENVVIQRDNGEITEIPADKMYILIGAVPRTQWLSDIVILDENGFVITGSNENVRYMESVPGIFAAGDVRLGSVKRIANAVGEGARSINDIHAYIQSLNEKIKV